MQTFLPYANYYVSAEYLDRTRLGNQRNEGYVLLKGGWPNHLAARMWRGYKYHLGLYVLAVCEVWLSYGYEDTVRERVIQELRGERDTGPPWWLGDEEFHSRHRAALLYKDPEYYGRKFRWREEPKLDYLWPVGDRHGDFGI